MKRFLTSLAYTLFALAAASCASIQPREGCINIYPREKLAEVSPLFWGTNFLFWVEDDEALADGSIEQSLRELPCRILRYPGGTVADNFHWETNMLDNPACFPFEQGEAESDFEEFMAFCGRVGAEPMLVVNTQSWALRGDIAGGAAEAARWVRYCREHGHKVKYWEIGNETYWHPVMTAHEYGALVREYSRAMKAEDPSIIVSANGGWTEEMTGDKERLEPALLPDVRERILAVKTVEEYKALGDEIKAHTAKPWTTGEDKWWDGVLEECADDIDMVSVHWYYFDNNVKNIDRAIIKLKKHLHEKSGGKDYLFCLSEYNCNTPEHPDRVCGFAESLGRFLVAGVDISCEWPLRIGGASYRSMLNLKTKEPQYAYEFFQLFQREFTGPMVRCDNDSDDLYTFASLSRSGGAIVISSRRLSAPQEIRVRPLQKVNEASVTCYTPDEKGLHAIPSEREFTLEDGEIRFTIDPMTIIFIRIK